MIALIVAVSVLTYLVGAGVTYAVGDECKWDYEFAVAPWFGVVLWPAVLPALLAAGATKRFITSREQKKLPEARIHRE